MTKLLTSTAVGLIAAFAVQAQAQDSNSQNAQMDDPCTAQWVSVDANSDGTISKSEAQKAMEVQFSQIDDDGDNMVSVKEWKDCTVPSAIPGGFQSAAGTGTDSTPPGALTEGETESTRALQAPQTGETPADWSDEMFAEMDTDYTGYVTSEEAGKWTRNRVSGTIDDEETLGRYGAMFSMMDMDSDGRISEAEWQAREQMTVESRFGSVDQDGDDQVSLKEWSDYREQRFGQAQQSMQQQGEEQQAQADAGQEPTLWLYYFHSL